MSVRCATVCYMSEGKPESVVGVRELRQNLSVYLARVKRGEAFLVTEHGHRVARLLPDVADADPLQRLIAGDERRRRADRTRTSGRRRLSLGRSLA